MFAISNSFCFERQPFLLFDRMVAYHIMNGISAPFDSTDFYKGLDYQFLKRDGMYFLFSQVNGCDAAYIAEGDKLPMYVDLSSGGVLKNG